MRAKSIKHVAAIVAVLFVVSGLAALAAPAPPRKPFIWAFSRGPAALVPWEYLGSPEHQLIQYSIFQNLVRFRPNSLEVEPNFARRWEVSPDGKVYTFHLRDDVFCHDDAGKITAEDAAFAFQILMDPSKRTYRSGSLSGIVSKVEIASEYVLRVTLERPMPSFLAAHVAKPHLSIVCKDAVDRLGLDEFARRPVGAGPYKVVSYERNGPVTLKAHERFFRGRPQIEDFRLVIIPEEIVQALALSKDEINFMVIREQETAKLLSRLSTVTVVRDFKRPQSMFWLQINTNRAPTNDVRVRQAMLYALDREAIRRQLVSELADSVANSVVIPTLFGYTDQVKKYEYNPQRARSLLEAAGHGRGISVDVVLIGTGSFPAVAQAVHAQWAKVGINATLHVLDRNQWQQRAQNGDYHVFVWETSRADIDEHLYETYHSSYKPPRIWNVSYYSGVDDLLERETVETDSARRRSLIEQIQRKIAEDAVTIPMWYTVGVTASRSYIQGNVANVGIWVVWPELYRMTQ